MLQDIFVLSQNRPHREVAIFHGDMTQKIGSFGSLTTSKGSDFSVLFIFVYWTVP